MYTLGEIKILDDAYKLVERWAQASYEAAFNPDRPVVLNLDASDSQFQLANPCILDQ